MNGEAREGALGYDKDNNLIQSFNYTDQRMPISMTHNNETYYLHYDQVGTLRAVSDKNHNIIKEVTYDTFGNILSDTNQNFKIPFGFAGGLHDRDTELVHFGYREYDPQTGKWSAKDPIDFSGGDSNLYGYVLGDPVNLVDSNGLEYNYIRIEWGYGKTGHNSFQQFSSFSGTGQLKFHAMFYNNTKAYTVMNHGYKGWSDLDLNKIAKNAKKSGKKYIELSICEIGQGNIPKELHDLSGLPIKYSEDYVFPPAFGIGSPTLSNSLSAKIHGWRWIR